MPIKASINLKQVYVLEFGFADPGFAHTFDNGLNYCPTPTNPDSKQQKRQGIALHQNFLGFKIVFVLEKTNNQLKLKRSLLPHKVKFYLFTKSTVKRFVRNM